MQLRWFRIPHLLKVGVSSLFVIAVHGIIGNRADQILEWIVSVVKKLITLKTLSVVNAILLTTIFILLLIINQYRKAHKIATQLNNIDETLLMLLSRLYASRNISGSLERLLEEFLDRILELLSFLEGCGVAIYCPDQNDPEYLTTLCQLESPNENKEKVRFYIGHDNHKKRGAAGHTFLDKKRRVIHFLKKDGQWQADSHEYIFFCDRRARRRPSYKTLITIPIIGDTSNSLGVLCLYSDYATAFDSQIVQDILVVLAGRLSTIMQVAQAATI